MDHTNGTYSAEQVESIQHAYRSIFPVITPELKDYWGLERRRDWSYVASNFHESTYEQFQSLDSAVNEINKKSMDFKKKGEALRTASKSCGVGFSIGICPWTDHLLSETYSDDKDHITIILGHDWYPIITQDDHPAGSPLGSRDALRYTERYWPAAPQAVFDAQTVGLFLNLYPDYRPPGDSKCGSLVKYGYSYAQCLTGLDATINALSQRFKSINLISWGTNVWRALQHRTNGFEAESTLTNHINLASGKILTIRIGSKELPYLPIFHPALWGNFGREFHLRHVKSGFASLNLGLPGPHGTLSNLTRKARSLG